MSSSSFLSSCGNRLAGRIPFVVLARESSVTTLEVAVGGCTYLTAAHRELELTVLDGRGSRVDVPAVPRIDRR